MTITLPNFRISALHHKVFWEELMEDYPDLKKLNQIGEQISNIVHEAKKHFRDLQNIDLNMAEIMKIYANFLIYILNDKEQGKQYLEQMRQRIELEGRKHKNIKHDPLNQPKATALVSLREHNLGVIQKANLLFSSLFGYQVEQIQGKNMNVIIPLLFQSYHEQFLIRFKEELHDIEQEDEEGEAGYLGNPQKRFGVTKNGYLMQLNYIVDFNYDEEMFQVEFHVRHGAFDPPGGC